MKLVMSQSDHNNLQSENEVTSSQMKEQITKDVRKQLPATPNVENQDNQSNGKQTPPIKPGKNGYGEYYLEYSIRNEYLLSTQQKLPGVYVIPSALSPLIWNGMLFVRQGLYQEGVFRFRLTIPDTFPDGDCPTLVFESPVFHPVVSPTTGELDVKRGFPKWRRNTNHIWQVLLYARRIFYKIDTKMPWNPEAAVLYEQDLDLFKKRVTECVKQSKEKIYEPVKTDDPYSLRVEPWDPNVHEETRKQMLQPKENEKNDEQINTRPRGLSWMKPTSIQIFSREDSAVA